MKKIPKSLLDFQAMFPHERVCADYLFEQRWPSMACSVRCHLDHYTV